MEAALRGNPVSIIYSSFRGITYTEHARLRNMLATFRGDQNAIVHPS